MKAAEKVHLSETHPEIFAELHPAKNGDLGNKKRIHARFSQNLVFVCSKGHEWKCSPERRIRGSSCYYCSGRKILPGFNDVLTLHPGKIEKVWSYKKNGEIPDNLSPAGGNPFYVKCDKGHEWRTKMNEVLRGRGCPYCSNKKVLIGYNDLSTTHPDIAARVSPESTYGPEEITAGSKKVLLWDCSEGHTFEASPYRLTGKDKRDCPVCAGKIVVPGVNDFASHYPDAAELWDYTKNPLSPEQVSYGSSKKYWWMDTCGHGFQKTPKEVGKGNSRCPYCSRTNSTLLVGHNDLATKFPLIAQEWDVDANGGIGADEIHHGTKPNYWWRCSVNSTHAWFASVSNRTLLGAGCPLCYSSKRVSDAENEISEYIESIGLTGNRDRSVLEGKELDIYIPEKRIAVEYNGIYWHSEAMGKDKWYHADKWKRCKEKGVFLLTVWEDNYLENPTLIKKMIAHKLGVSQETSIPARKLAFSRIASTEAEAFLRKHHLQGPMRAARHFALMDTYADNVVAVMSVIQKKGGSVLEVSRFASSRPVPGGFTKLLTNILRLDKYRTMEKIISYSHNDHSWGEVYQKNGFTKVHEGTPGYFYIANNRREHRLNYSPKRFREREDLIFEEGKTERELADLNGLSRIWDCGSARWEKGIPQQQD